MTLRSEVRQPAELGPLPAERSASAEVVGRHEDLIRAISRPVSDDEARALARLFGPDGCFGLGFALVHLIESSPGWPLADVLADQSNEWLQDLQGRVSRKVDSAA